MQVYFNTKTNATRKMSKTDLNKLPEDMKKRWRVASESEIELHEQREAQSAILASKNKEREKAVEDKKKQDAKSQKKNKTNKPAEATEEAADAGLGSEG